MICNLKITSRSEKNCVKISWWSDIPLKSYQRKTVLRGHEIHSRFHIMNKIYKLSYWGFCKLLSYQSSIIWVIWKLLCTFNLIYYFFMFHHILVLRCGVRGGVWSWKVGFSDFPRLLMSISTRDQPYFVLFALCLLYIFSLFLDYFYYGE